MGDFWLLFVLGSDVTSEKSDNPVFLTLIVVDSYQSSPLTMKHSVFVVLNEFSSLCCNAVICSHMRCFIFYCLVNSMSQVSLSVLYCPVCSPFQLDISV